MHSPSTHGDPRPTRRLAVASRRSMLLAIAAASIAAAAALPIASGGAQSAPRTISVTYAQPEKTFLDDAPPRTLRRGGLTLGDRIVQVQGVRIDGRRAGTYHTDATVTNRVATGFARFTALLQSTLHLSDGDIYATGFVDAARGGDRQSIVGGTGAYAGARGSVVGSENGAVITLER